MIELNDRELQAQLRRVIPDQDMPRETLARALAATRLALDEERNVPGIMRAVESVGRNVEGALQRIGLLKEPAQPLLSDADDPGTAAPLIPYARVSPQSGAARVQRGERIANVQPGQVVAVRQGDRVVARDGGLSVRLFGGQQATLNAGADARFIQFAQSAAGRLVNIVLDAGRAVANITRPLAGGDAFVMGSSTAVANVRGTEFVSEALGPESTYFATLRGKIAVRMGDAEIELPAGQQLSAVVGQPMVPEPIPELAATPPPALPPEPPKPKPAMPTGVRIYIAAQGDTVFGVAARFGITVEALLRLNPALRSRFTLAKGEPVVIPLTRQKP